MELPGFNSNNDINSEKIQDDQTKETKEEPEITTKETKEEPAQSDEEKAEYSKERKKLQEAIEKVDIWISSAVENGLFTNKKDLYKPILENLKSARRNLKQGDLIESNYKLDLVLDQYSDAIHSTNRRWKFINVYAMDIWIYLIAFLTLVFIFYLSELDGILKSPPFAESALHSATWGTIGGILRGLWFLKDGVSERSYRKAYRILYFSIPFLGGIFGVLSYLIIAAGLLTFGGLPTEDSAIGGLTNTTKNVTPQGNMTQNVTSQITTIGNTTQNVTSHMKVTENIQVNGNTNEPSTIRSLLFIPVAALAGFNWEWFMMIFKRFADIFSITKDQSLDKIRT